MKTVFEATLTHPDQPDGQKGQLYTSLDKAHAALQKQHAGSEWAGVPMPALHIYREKLRQYSSHSVQVVNEADDEAEFTISERVVH